MKLAIIKVDPPLDQREINNMIQTLRKVKRKDTAIAISNFLEMINNDLIVFNSDSIIIHKPLSNHEVSYLLFILNIQKAHIFTKNGLTPFYHQEFYDDDIQIFFSEEELLEAFHDTNNVLIKNAILSKEELKNILQQRTFFGKCRFKIISLAVRVSKRKISYVDMIIRGSGHNWKKEIFYLYTRHIGRKKYLHPFVYLLNQIF